MEPNIGIETKNRHAVCHLLNMLLADEYVLYTKTLNYHWNVYNPAFDALHLFFRRLYEQEFQIVDDIAERVRTVGDHAWGTLEDFKKNTRLKEKPSTWPHAQNMIRDMLDDHESIIRQIRHDLDECQKLGDMGTNNFLTDIMEQHEKMAWMLRASLEK